MPSNSHLKTLGATALVAAIGSGLLLRSSIKKPLLVRDHGKVAKKLGDSPKAEDLNEAPEYDVVIVGGGTAGCVVASRLSEDPNIKVLLLEAGGSGVVLPFSTIPAAYGNLFGTKADHNLWTVPQNNASGKEKYWPRGRMLGGSSAMNAMMFHIGDPADYDEWATLMKDEPGASQWKFSNFKQYFLKFEKYVPQVTDQKLNATQRGSSGKVSVGFYSDLSQIVSHWVDSCVKVGIPRSLDFNTEAGTIGVSRIMTYISPHKERVSSEAAYLTPDVLKRPNLVVVTHAQVTKLLFNDSKDKVTGVEFANTRTKTIFRVRAKREVVLSAGAVHTPHILLLSGIGPAAELAKHKIPIARDLPGVGRHLMDHPAVNLRFRVKSGMSNVFVQRRTGLEVLRSIGALLTYKISRSGPLTSNIAEAAAFVRTDDKNLFPDPPLPSDPMVKSASGPNAPDLELFGSPMSWTEHGRGPIAPGDSASIGITALRPTSLGTITLKSADPFEPPVIDPHYLETRHDLDVLIRGVQLGLRIARADPYAQDILSSHSVYTDNVHDMNLEELEKLVRERTETLYHPTSTARMAPLADEGVLDGYLRVYGIPNLRVADASAFPNIISGHTAAPSFAIGEKAADLIRGMTP